MMRQIAGIAKAPALLLYLRVVMEPARTAVPNIGPRPIARAPFYASHHFNRNATIKTTIEAVKM
jgi:hypothetical protein